MSEPLRLHESADERQRALIREALDETMLVEAGAGTGKTRALVDRVVALVLAGRRIDRIVAITFTEKAAAELRDRVRAGLEQAQATQAEHRELIDAALGALDQAQISTIHAFGLTLLRFFAAEAGIDPAFQVLDELQTERRFQERWRAYLESLAADESAAAAIDRVLALGLTTREVERLARELAARAEFLEVLERAPPRAEPPVWPAIGDKRQALEEVVASAAPPAGDRLLPRLQRLEALLRRLVQPGADREALLAAGAAVLNQSYGVGRQDDWGGRDEARHARDLAKGISDQLAETLAACRAEALAALLPFVTRFVIRDIEARAREGTLTFDDLILFLRGLLLTSPEAVRALRERYDALLIDEFQDTDPRQVDIARAFAADPKTGQLEPGRLFLVGDPKQSIYRFRGADMAIYSEMRVVVEEHRGKLPVLSLNRRSPPVVLEWVNGVFKELIGPGDDPAVQPPYRPIQASRDGQVRGPGVAWFGGALNASAREVRYAEARAVAQQCLAACSEKWQVVDGDDAVRTASLRDIAVLIPTRSVLLPLERALASAGIPYRVEGGSLLYRTQEVRDLINCLTAIDDPADEVAVVGALRSAAFACSDVELASHRAAGGRFNYLGRDLDESQGPVANALRALRQYHARRHGSSLAAFVEHFVGEQGLVEVGVLDQGDRNSFRRMRFMVEQAQAFEANGPESLRAFVAWMERRAGQALLEREGGVMDDDEDAVRILTMHGAKGLEFPIVFVAGLGATTNSRPPVFGTDLQSGRIAICAGTKSRFARFTLGPVDEIEAAEKAHANAESARLLYVAATRARDHLVLSLFHSQRAQTCHARRLIDSGATELANERPDVSGGTRMTSTPFADLNVERDDEEAFQERRAVLIEDARRQRYTSATALGREHKNEATDETEPWSRGRGGTRVGRAVHATIQSVPWDADDQLISAVARAQAVAEAVPNRAREVAGLVRQALQSEAAMRARGALRALREVPFAIMLDGTILEGFADLVIDTEDGIEIVDWKTDDVPEEAVPSRLEEYALQAGLYVLGLEQATGKPVLRVSYVFVRPNVEASPGEPQALKAAATAVLTRVPGG
jgi:ATP-dependent helicase/nuclease subunit A